jgi:hypothetical protein
MVQELHFSFHMGHLRCHGNFILASVGQLHRLWELEICWCKVVGALKHYGEFHVHDLAVSLFAVRAAVHQGMAVFFRPGSGGACVVLQRNGHTIFTASEHGGSFHLDTQFLAAAAVTGGVQSAVLWHRRLGHLGFSTVADLAMSGLIHGCSVTASDFM